MTLLVVLMIVVAMVGVAFAQGRGGGFGGIAQRGLRGIAEVFQIYICF